MPNESWVLLYCLSWVLPHCLANMVVLVMVPGIAGLVVSADIAPVLEALASVVCAACTSWGVGATLGRVKIMTPDVEGPLLLLLVESISLRRQRSFDHFCHSLLKGGVTIGVVGAAAVHLIPL